jgi:phosphate acetyltransferase
LVPSLKSRNLGADIDLNVIPFGQFSGEFVNPAPTSVDHAGCCNAQNWCLRAASQHCSKDRSLSAEPAGALELHKIVEPFTARAAARNSTIVFPEGEDVRILHAAARLRDAGLANAILLAGEQRVSAAAAGAGVSLAGIEIVDPETSGFRDQVREAMLRKKPNLDDERLEAMARDPLVFGGVLVASGRADAMIAGAVAETGRVISASLRTIGLVEGMNRLSSYFLMSVPNHRGQGRKDFLFADCAVNIDPDADELAEIAIATMATAARLLDQPPKGALLSFSTKGSASHANVTKVTEALAVIRKVAP